MGLETMAVLQIVQGGFGVLSAASAASAADAQADAQVQELERQKDEERLNARSQKSDRARQADKEFASMLASMADNGGLGTGNASRYAGEIGGVAGIDFARIEGNSISKINQLSSQQRSARMQAQNAKTQAAFSAFSSIIGAAGGVMKTEADAEDRAFRREQAKQRSLGRPQQNISVKS